MIDASKLCLDKRKIDNVLLKCMSFRHASSASNFTTNDQGSNYIEESSVQASLMRSDDFMFPLPVNRALYQRPHSSSPCYNNATSDSDTQSTQSDSDCRCARSSPRKILYPKKPQHENLSDPCNHSFGNGSNCLPPIGVFWDIENCNVPKGRSALQVVQVIRNTFLNGYREEEFIVVCDVTKESSQIVRELSDAQVNLIHVPSQCKNAADEKLRQSIRRFADRHGTPSAVVLITGDINFSAEVCDLRHRRKVHVTLLHHNSSSTSEALRLSANEAYDIGTLMDNLPPRESKEPFCELVEVMVLNLPQDKDSTRIKARLRKLSYNCGGRVNFVGKGMATVQFTSMETAVRAQKRMEGEDVYGHKITVGPPIRVIRNGSKASSTPKGHVSYTHAQEGHQYLVSNCVHPQVMASVYCASAHSVYSQYNSNPNLGSSNLLSNPSSLLGAHPNATGNRTYVSPFEQAIQSVGMSPPPAMKSGISNGWQSTVCENMPPVGRAILGAGNASGQRPAAPNERNEVQTVGRGSSSQVNSIFSYFNKNFCSSNTSILGTGPITTFAQTTPNQSSTANFVPSNNSKAAPSANHRPGSGPCTSKTITQPIIQARPRSNTPPVFFGKSQNGIQGGTKLSVGGLTFGTKNILATSNSSEPLGTQYANQQKNSMLSAHTDERQERFFHPISSSTNGTKSDIIELQVTNLDQNTEIREMKKLITAAFSEHVTVLSVSMHTQSDGNLAAYVKLPSLEEAQYAVSQLHRRKIGYKRVMIAYVGTRGPSPQLLRSQIVSLLAEIPSHSLPLFKFCELFESRYLTSISVSEMYKMKDVCLITDGPSGRMVALNPDHRHTPSPAFNNVTNEFSMELPYCTIHRPGPDKGWAEQEMQPLPNVRIGLKVLMYRINILIESHGGSIPLPSLPHCYEAQFHVLEVDEVGVPLEHLVSCLSGIEIYQGVGCVKYLRWSRPKKETDGQEPIKCVSPQLVNQQSLFSRELVELLRISPRCQIVFNRFIPAYHHHFGRQCRVADYGFTKLIDLFESLPQVIQILGEGNNRIITLAHRAQIRRFTSDLLRVLKSQASKQVLLSQFPVVYQRALSKEWDVTDYGVCEVGDLLGEVSEASVSVTVESDDIAISIPKREQTPEEFQRTKIFADEVVELLRHAPQCSMLFNKFIPAYHHHFGHQCRVSDYGFTKLIELFESIPHVVKVTDGPEGKRCVELTLPESLKVLADQISLLVGASKNGMLPVSQVATRYLRQFGFALKPEMVGCNGVSQTIQMLRTVKLVETPNGAFVELADHPETPKSWAPNCSQAFTNTTGLRTEDAVDNLLKTYGGYLKNFVEHGSSTTVTLESGPPKPDTPPKVIPAAWNNQRAWQSNSPPLYSPFQTSSLQAYMDLSINLPPSELHPHAMGSPTLTSPTKSLLDAHHHPINTGVNKQLPHIMAPDPSLLPRPHSLLSRTSDQLSPKRNCDLGVNLIKSNGESTCSSSAGDEASSSCKSVLNNCDSTDLTANSDSIDMDSSGRSTPSITKRRTRLAAQFSTPIHT